MTPESEADKSEEYKRFEALARGLIDVPKDELDVAMEKDKKQRKRRRATKSPRPAPASQ